MQTRVESKRRGLAKPGTCAAGVRKPQSSRSAEPSLQQSGGAARRVKPPYGEDIKASATALHIQLVVIILHITMSMALNASRARPLVGATSRRLAVRVRADKCLIVNTKV